MVNIATLTKSINEALQRMDATYRAAQRSMEKITPNLHLAKELVTSAEQARDELAMLVLQAQAQGILQPPDVVRRINDRSNEIHALTMEIVHWVAVQVAGDARPKPPTYGKNASN